MQVGLSVPQLGPTATAERAREVAQAAEAAGFDSLWVVDHVVLHEDGTTRYPYSPDGALRLPPAGNFLEPLILLTYLAGVTERIQLATGVLVLPMREPVLHAKMIATLDHLSGGRVILGAGVGWWVEEFEVLGVNPRTRGSRMDESLALLRELWTGDPVRFEGRHFQVEGWLSNPTPAHHIPIWLGGESRQQLERVGRVADGWLPTAGKSFETFRDDFEVARQAASDAGRDPESLDLAMIGAAEITADTMEAAFERLSALKEEGVTHVSARVTGDPRDQLELMAEFGDRYLPALHDQAAT